MKNAKDDPSVEDKNRSADPADGTADPAQAVDQEQGSAEQREAPEPEESIGKDLPEAESAESENKNEPSLEEQLAAARAQAQENYNNYLRAIADLDTYRRRVAREKDDLRQYAISGLLEDLLPVYDNLSLGLASAEQTSDPKVVVQGIQMVLAQLRNLLEERGVAEIAPQKGEDFDPNQAEAFQTQPSDEIEEGKVLSLMRKGFSLNGRLVRPATVVVSGGSSQDASEA